MAYKRISPIPIVEGGTNASTFATTDGTVIFDGTRLITIATGTSGQILTSAGVGLPPAFQTGAASTISITGDTGGALTSGTFTFTGGTTGLSFGGSGTTETLTFAGITANGGTVSLATDATTSTINVGTGAGAKTSTFGSASSTSSTTVQSGSGALNITATGGALTINSGTGTLSVSSDASATTVNIATGAAAKTVTLGSTNSTSVLALKYGTADFTLASATGTVMSALDTGEITYPLQSAFLAQLSATATNVTGNTTQYTVICDTEIFDQNSDYNNATGTFTAPITGRYALYVETYVTGCTIATFFNGYIITSNRAYNTAWSRAASNSDGSVWLSSLCDMDSGDIANSKVTVTGEAAATDDVLGGVGALTSFSGYLAC